MIGMYTYICSSCKSSFKVKQPKVGYINKYCNMSCRDKFQVGQNSTNYKHGGNLENKPEYNSWRAMRERCNNPKYWCYHRYGGRGIKVDPSWEGSFKNFLSDMGKKPTPKHTLDRIDNDGDYTPDNCLWSDVIRQRNNTSRSRFETVDGETKTVAEWCRVYGINRTQISNREANGMSFEEALKTPKSKPGKHIKSYKMPRPVCSVCGKTCKYLHAKYCSNDCYFRDRWGFVRQQM